MLINQQGTIVLMTLMAMTLLSCEKSMGEKRWLESTVAPKTIQFWQGSEIKIRLPARRIVFVDAILSLGGHYYVTGEGEAAVLRAPLPMIGSPCRPTVRAVVVDFPSERLGETPRYVGYLDDADVVQCVEKQFSYVG